MRCLLVLTVLAAGCTGVPVNGPHYDSARERLSTVPTSLYVHDEASTGMVTARRRGHDGWRSAQTELAVQHGYVRAAVDDNGQLAIDQLDIAIAPITLDGMFGKPAQLQDVRLRLVEPARGEVTWTSADDATATLAVAFDFDWAIAFDGGEAFPLATQHLPPTTIDVVLAGNGEHVGAWLDLDAVGELWNWAGLVQISELALSVRAETAD